MIFHELPLVGAFLVDMEPAIDERGFFARSFCVEEFKANGLEAAVAQCSVSYNAMSGTLRGLHYQSEPYGEVKLVRCTAGSIFDVIVDIRRASSTFGKWHGEVLSADNHRALYIPPGFAHGFQTLVDDTEVYYQISRPHHPTASSGILWDDRDIAIEWPQVPPIIISDRDQGLPALSEGEL